MKIKLSKRQWQFIGRKTGWIKSAQLEKTPPLYQVVDLIDIEQGSGDTFDLTFDVLGPNASYRVDVIAFFEYEPESYDRTTSPLGVGFYYSRMEINNIDILDEEYEPIVETRELTDEEKEEIYACINNYLEKHSDEYSESLHDR